MAREHPLWDPLQYQRYASERRRPGAELMARIGQLPEGPIADLGCGAGEDLIALTKAYPGRAATGVDLSPEMLAEARKAAPEISWVESDIAGWRAAEPLALLFTNAALHWLGRHEKLIPALFAQVKDGGVFAAQMPSNLGSEAHEIARDICLDRGWAAAADAMFRVDWVLPAPHYYDLLRAHGAISVDAWEATYWHALGALGVTDWVKGTALRPILVELSPAEGASFLEEYDAQVRAAYPAQPDGVTLYPQSRVFFIARK